MTSASPTGLAPGSQAVPLDELRVGGLLAEGGEGRVFELPLQPHLVFKSYRRPVPRAYLDELVAWPGRIAPELATRVQAAAAWPAATVVDPQASRHRLDRESQASCLQLDRESQVAAGSHGGAALSSPRLPEAGAHGGATFTRPRLAGASGHGGAAISSLRLAGAGVLLPRAPRRFALRHRDGTTRLASLSYLTADPSHRAVAYGLALPPPVSPQRLGLVYALARLLEAFEDAAPAVGHGDLSTKNVLWSLQRGPEVFVLDCDNCERFAEGAGPVGDTPRRRPMTPNWEDPSIPSGTNPTVESDRYSLALIFLRVVGAANFPIQARQREAPSVTVDFAVPPAQFGDALLGPGAPLWDLCERGLSLDPAARPHPSAWAAALEAALDAFGAAEMMRAVWATQGGGRPAQMVALPPVVATRDVTIRPVRAAPRPAPRWTIAAAPRREEPWPRGPSALAGSGTGSVGGAAGAGAVSAAPGPPASAWLASPTSGPGYRLHRAGPPGGGTGPAGGPAPSPPVGRQALAYLAEMLRWWLGLHRRAARTVWSRRRHGGAVGAIAACMAVDAVAVLVLLFLVAMIVAPILGI